MVDIYSFWGVFQNQLTAGTHHMVQTNALQEMIPSTPPMLPYVTLSYLSDGLEIQPEKAMASSNSIISIVLTLW